MAEFTQLLSYHTPHKKARKIYMEMTAPYHEEVIHG